MNGDSLRERVPWPGAGRAEVERLRSPGEIQAWLDTVPYSTEPVYRCPLSVLRDRVAHCFDGAVFAAAALESIGFPPLIMQLDAERDDEHILALFRREERWGAVAKSNFSGLRFREPVFRTLRELALSYFEDYFNVEAEKTLRGYSAVVDLRRFARRGWRERDEVMEEIASALDSARHYALLTPTMTAALLPVDERSYRAGTLGIDLRGAYDPRARS